MDGLGLLTVEDPLLLQVAQRVLRRAEELREQHQKDLARLIRNEIVQALSKKS